MQPLWSPSGLPDQLISLCNKNSWLWGPVTFLLLHAILLLITVSLLHCCFELLFFIASLSLFYLSRFLSNIVGSIPIIVFLTDHCSKTRLSVDGFPLTFLFLFLCL